MRCASGTATVQQAAVGYGTRCRRRPCPVLAQASNTGSASNSDSQAAIQCSLKLAAVRAAEQQQSLPLFADAFSAALVDTVGSSGSSGSSDIDAAGDQLDALATRFLDEQLLKAVTAVNLERDNTQEYNQVVLVGDAFDTRPFRLPWPEGTVIFCVAPAEAHQRAKEAFKAQGARVPRGCLLCRVPAQLLPDDSTASFAGPLERAGFRGDRLSVWVMQGISCLGLGMPALGALLADTCNLAAFDSLVAGLLPPMDRRGLDNLLASFGLLGAGVDFGPQTDWGRWQTELALDPAGVRPWLFVAQQKRLSLREMEIYEQHVAAAAEDGEDFEGNFS